MRAEIRPWPSWAGIKGWTVYMEDGERWCHVTIRESDLPALYTEQDIERLAVERARVYWRKMEVRDER